MAAVAYGSRSVLLAAAATLMVNFLIGALLTITLPSLILPGAGAPLMFLRACVLGLALAPTSQRLLGAMAWHTGTILVEMEAYILAAFFGLMVPIYIFSPQEGATGSARYARALALNARGSLLVLIVLAAAALYEAAEVIAQMPGGADLPGAQQGERLRDGGTVRGGEKRSAAVSLRTAAPYVCDLRPATSGAGPYDVDRARALRALLGIELHGLVLSQGLETRALNGAVVDEHVRRAVIRGDETETLGITEPLHFTFSHCQTFAKKQVFVRADARRRV
jgi:hypothetical protein